MVAGVSYDENALLFVQSLRPYLGPHGNGCLIALESLLELLHSEPAKKTLDSLRILGPGEGFKALTMPDISQKESKPATLFLLQALLFLADAPMAKMLFGVQSEEKSEDKIEAEQAWDLP
ncbi:hypothetical protein [Syntrophaceticus schinkii]|jgi:hypothetical protein|uniref:Uncharacterized protein n=1 Tax=Syntrophaceticus schinkii TaxID=499207 RepID=A0A0B7MGG8_9FIRM|nr:hypothetical protein [Syntrophaceticus schinkii]MDD2359631.1 hypothetical protein [Syntrophaceticus schinkii]MDD4261230.1 hypothetical protein [Syntrophaceticus schinkii]CEO87293.1 hypothetical protein SSCH_10027 [Syntrophaceticus schinkii]